jgi:uncharacterized membrane protein
MTLKKYQQIKLVMTVVIAIIFSQSIVFKNFIIPIIVLIISSLSLMILRRQVKEVVADERDRITAGTSALLTIQIFSWCSAIIMFVLYAFRDSNFLYQPIAMTLAFSTCILMTIYSFVFRFYNHVKFSEKKGKIIALVIVFTVFLSIFIRLFSGKDSWVCRNGQWIKHGIPAVPAPITICK